MKNITLKLTNEEWSVLEENEKNTTYFCQLSCWSPNLAVTILDAQKFLNYLEDEIGKCFPTDDNGKITQPVEGINVNVNPKSKYYEGSESQKQDTLKSILSKVKSKIMKNLQNKIIIKEGLRGLIDEITEACSYAESDGQFYNGIRIDEDTMLVLMSYWDKNTTLTEYFHYSISKDELVSVDAEMDEKYRDLFADCDMLDSFNCFYIVGIEPSDDNTAKIVYGDESLHPTMFKIQSLALENKSNDLNCDEPKCTKCGSEFEDEYWKTDGLEYEDYICSNNKCCAVHRINIERLDDRDGYPKDYCDVERDWKSLEFRYIWEQGLKNDDSKLRIFNTPKDLISFLRANANEDATDEWLVANSYHLGEWERLENGKILHRWESGGGVQDDEPKNELLDKAKALIKAIDDNLWSLWENDIENKHDCVLWYKDKYQLDMDENDNWETEEKEGISKAYNELKELITKS